MSENKRCPVCCIRHFPSCGTARSRWPLAPLAALLDSDNLAGDLHVSSTVLHRMETEGLTDEQADRHATRNGFHPCLVWPDWFDAAMSPVDRDYLAGGWRQAWLAAEAAS